MWEIITPILTAIFGGGLSTLILISVLKRKGNAEARTTEQSNIEKTNDEWRKLYQELSERLEKVREEKAILWKEHVQVNKELAYYKTCHCENYSCPNRVPPLGNILREKIGINDSCE